jgi:3-keto-disaccharide hydrolase
MSSRTDASNARRRTNCAGSLVAAALLLAMLSPTVASAQPDSVPRIVGRWDLRVQGRDGVYPSWLEVTTSGYRVLVGRFVGRVGSARPISRVDYASGKLRFSIPPQWDRETADLQFEGSLAGDRLTGTITLPSGEKDSFTGSRSPSLLHAAPVWGAPIELFNGKDLSGWKTEGGQSHWTVVNGVLTSTASGANLVSTRTFSDFKLHVEFRYPKGGNSGVYLRGRHEVQIEDTPPRDFPLSVDVGGVYGFLTPNEIAATGPGKWQTYDITLVGRRVTVVLNGRTIIADQIIPGITGGALDSDEGAPGPLLLQGDHLPIEYRNIRLTPAK